MKSASHKKTGRIRFIGITAAIVAILVLLDQLTKHLAVSFLKDKPDFIIVEGVLRFQYLENRGAAFGMLQGSQVLFAVMTIVFLSVIVYFFFRVPLQKKYHPAAGCLSFLAAGAVGNFIDRVTQHYVVDFIYLEFIHFPIFNVADMYVSLSLIVFVLLCFFYYKEGDFSFLKPVKRTGGRKPEA